MIFTNRKSLRQIVTRPEPYHSGDTRPERAPSDARFTAESAETGRGVRTEFLCAPWVSASLRSAANWKAGNQLDAKFFARRVPTTRFAGPRPVPVRGWAAVRVAGW